MFDQIELVEYDDFGRMKYNRDLHFNQGKQWDEDDIDYLINWFAKTGAEEMSLALGRTEGSIARKIHDLRKQGKMSFESGYNIRLLRDKNKYEERKSPNPNGRPPKLKVDIETLIKLKETKTFKEIATMYKVSSSIVEKRIMKYRKATKDPDQSIQSSTCKISIPLYHESRGVQVG